MLRGITVALLALPASAALADGHAIGLKVGALGLGAEYTYTQRDSNVPTSEYDRNLWLVTANFTL